MKEMIDTIKKNIRKGHFQSAVARILNIVESDAYRNNESIKDIYYTIFADGGTIKDMIEYENLKLVRNSDEINTIEDIDNYTYYMWFTDTDNKEIVVNSLNETVLLRALRDLEKLL